MKERTVVLSVQNLKKRIKDKMIIKGISFDVREGEVFGFLGPNGAGKTTTIRMLVNLIRPTEGTVAICGVDVRERPNEALKNVGCIVENPELYAYLTGWENLEHFARMFPNVTEDRIREVVHIVGMDKRIHDKVRTYSLGMRQRLGIAQALLGYPKLLILDEPTNGLDPQGIKEMRLFIRDLANSGIGVFVSSHLLSEIQLMCDRVAIISQGSVIAVGEVAELIGRSAPTVVWKVDKADQARVILGEYEIEGGDSIALAETPDEALAGSIPSVEIATQIDAGEIPGFNRRLVQAGVNVFAIRTESPTLEDLFLQLTEGEQIG